VQGGKKDVQPKSVLATKKKKKRVEQGESPLRRRRGERLEILTKQKKKHKRRSLGVEEGVGRKELPPLPELRPCVEDSSHKKKRKGDLQERRNPAKGKRERDGATADVEKTKGELYLQKKGEVANRREGNINRFIYIGRERQAASQGLTTIARQEEKKKRETEGSLSKRGKERDPFGKVVMWGRNRKAFAMPLAEAINPLMERGFSHRDQVSYA